MNENDRPEERWECGPHTNAWSGHDARCRRVPVDENGVNDEHYEWHDEVGRAIMLATRCTHEGDDFGSKAVCVTCFENAQVAAALVERFAHRAFEQGRRAERRDWELTADLSTPDEGRQPWPNPYCAPTFPPGRDGGAA